MRDLFIVKLFLFSIVKLSANGQTDIHKPDNRDLNQESSLINTDEGQYTEDNAQAWINISENPFDLNLITREELQSLSLLSISQINNFFNYLDIHGKLISIYELQAIPEFDVNIIRKILPLVTVKSSATNHNQQPLQNRIFNADNHYLVLRLNKILEKKSGFDKNRQSSFSGSPYQWLVKYRSSKSQDFSVGLTMEKDAGEKFSWQPENRQYGPDFWSFHFSLKNRGRLKNFTLGDYKLQIGQGILFAAGFYPGKGAETIVSIRRSNLGIIPYTSTIENGFLRGIASTYQIGRFSLTSFYSGKRTDATIKFDSLNSNHLFSSITESGLHRTSTEIDQLKSLKELLFGINLVYLSKDKNLSIGQIVSMRKYHLNPLKSNKLYKKFTPDDNPAIYLGYNFSYNWENFHFFGEGVLANNRGYGLILGALASFSEKVQFSLLFRKYQANFHSPYGSGFSENTANNNETGIYWGLKLSPSRKFSVAAYMDVFNFPWLKFGVDRPSIGNEHLIALIYRFTKHTKISGRLRTEKKDINFSEESAKLNSIVTRQNVNWQLSFDNNISQLLSTKTNIQWSSFKKSGNKSNGFSVSQDLNISWFKFKISNRIMLFDTENFDNRHYRYERNLLYSLSIPAFSGSGYRYYTMFQTKIFSKISLWIRLARTIYFDRLEIGSGQEQIQAPHKTELRCQVKYTFK